MRALVFFGPNRVEKIKEVPTARELGYEVTWANPNWWLAPKGTPQDRLDVIANAFKTIMADPEIQTWFSDRVLDPYWTDGEQARAESGSLGGKRDPCPDQCEHQHDQGREECVHRARRP